jgi:energy-coupling factor transporter transmembrane protein EcfT
MVPVLARIASPAARLLGAVALVSAVATAPLGSAPALAVSSAVALGAIAVCRPSLKTFFARALPALGAIAALLVPLLWAGRASDAGSIAARSVLALATALAFAAALGPGELAAGMRALRAPVALTMVVATLLHKLALARDEARRIGLARRLRGARGPTLGADAFVSLLVGTARRAERAELALSLRGHSLEEAAWRARLRPADATVLLAVSFAAISVHLAGRWG